VRVSCDTQVHRVGLWQPQQDARAAARALVRTRLPQHAKQGQHARGSALEDPALRSMLRWRNALHALPTLPFLCTRMA
jgi:hypothetical protein